MNLVSGHDLSFSYDQESAGVLSGLNLDIDEGAMIWLRGGNGSGKTTLLKIVCGLLKPTRGSITRQIAVTEMGILFGRPGFKLAWTVAECLNYFRELTGSTSEEMESTRQWLGFEDKKNRLIAELSLGWQRKLACARVLMKPRRLYVLDEPFSHLDDASTIQLMDELGQKVKEGASVIYTSHRKVSSASVKTLDLEMGKLK